MVSSSKFGYNEILICYGVRSIIGGFCMDSEQADKGLPKPDEIYNEWADDPKRLIFLIDETRRPIYEVGDEIILYTCVALNGQAAHSIMKAIQRARTTDEPFKGRDIVRPEVQRNSAPVISVWCQSLHLVEDVKIVATTGKGQKKISKSAKARFNLVPDQSGSRRPRILEGRELGTMIHLILKMAIDLKISGGQVDVIIDRSEQFGMATKKRRLPNDVMEVFGPSRLDARPGGSQASLKCPAMFRLIADSDEGPFRDLLMLPDFYGYLLSRETNHGELYKSLLKEPVLLLPFDIARAKEQQCRFRRKDI